jgi:hypothetical protein
MYRLEHKLDLILRELADEFDHPLRLDDPIRIEFLCEGPVAIEDAVRLLKVDCSGIGTEPFEPCVRITLKLCSSRQTGVPKIET